MCPWFPGIVPDVRVENVARADSLARAYREANRLSLQNLAPLVGYHYTQIAKLRAGVCHSKRLIDNLDDLAARDPPIPGAEPQPGYGEFRNWYRASGLRMHEVATLTRRGELDLMKLWTAPAAPALRPMLDAITEAQHSLANDPHGMPPTLQRWRVSLGLSIDNAAAALHMNAAKLAYFERRQSLSQVAAIMVRRAEIALRLYTPPEAQ